MFGERIVSPIICEVCGATHIEVKAWVKWNRKTQTYDFIEEAEPNEIYCEDCDKIREGRVPFVKIVTRSGKGRVP